jgi:hypothetical protein
MRLRSSEIVWILFVILFASACATISEEVDQSSAIETQVSVSLTEIARQSSATATIDSGGNQNIEDDAILSSQTYLFEELGFSLDIPNDLIVKRNPLVNLNDTTQLESYLFYIQNYGGPGGESSGDFQMYGHLQFNLPTTSWETFAEDQIGSPMYDYVIPIQLDSLKGFETQLSGQRNNFVYLFHLDGHVLTIAVSAPTNENKALAEEILGTLEVISAGIDNSSRVKLFESSDPFSHLFIPEDWTIEIGDAKGIRLVDLEATSPDFEMFIEETDGPHANIYFREGVQMQFYVLDDNSGLRTREGVEIISSYTQYFDGIEGIVETFIEPSTAEGQLREARIFYEGKSYFLRFSYSETVDDFILNRIINSLKLYE